MGLLRSSAQGMPCETPTPVSVAKNAFDFVNLKKQANKRISSQKAPKRLANKRLYELRLSKYLSASSAAIHPVPALVTA
jgi:hypothetical protein